MIFVTVGAQMPFDRLVDAVDAWAARTGAEDVVAQIGPSRRRPSNLRTVEFLAPAEFRDHVAKARLVVAHAGMGTILTALELARPLVVMPRRGDLGETRNDHQVATAARFRELGRVRVADNAAELEALLDRAEELTAPERIEARASPELLRALREFATRGPAGS